MINTVTKCRECKLEFIPGDYVTVVFEGQFTSSNTPLAFMQSAAYHRKCAASKIANAIETVIKD